jgi:CTP:molybdopterin cytidylyltransferase MocA
MTVESVGGAGPFDAVVLAGSINRIALFPGNRPGRKALVELHGKPLLQYTLEALAGARSAGRILVVGAPDVLALAARQPGVEGVPEGRSLIDNAWRGLRAARTERVLFCNPDQPLLRPEMVDDFTDRARRRDADLVSSWVRHADLGRYAEAEHKFADFGDGRFAHGNLFLVRRAFPERPAVRKRLDRLYRARKSNLRFAWALGPKLFARYLLSRLSGPVPTLEETLDMVGEEFGVRLAAVLSPYPEIVLDIDEPEDFAAAARFVALDAREDGAARREALAAAG